MPRALFTAIRLIIVVTGVTAIVLMVNWRTVVVTPAGDIGFDGTIRDVARTHDVEMSTPAGDGMMLVVTTDGMRAQVGIDRIRPGLLDLLADANWWWVLIGLGLVGCVYPLQATRWWLLMRCRGLGASWPRTLRLVLVGAFCNFFLPGTEGGDVVKAWGAARGADRRVEAVMSVVFDRITGLAGLVLVAAGVGIFLAESPQSKSIGIWTAIGMVAVAVIGIAAFVVTERGWLRLPEVARSFGGGLSGRVVDAATAYKRHPGAVAAATGVSVCVQVLLAAAAGCCAWAVGARHELIVILAVMPILFIAAAVPLTWQGAGVMELLGIALLAGPGVATVSQVIALLVLYRALEFTWGLAGSLLMLGGDIQLHPGAENTC